VPKIYKLVAMSVFLIIAAFSSGCSSKRAELPPVVEKSIVEEEHPVAQPPEVEESIIEEKPSVVQPPEMEESIIEEEPPAAQSRGVKRITIEEKPARADIEIDDRRVPDDKPSAVPAQPQDADGVTSDSTSLLLPLNGVSKSNSLDYDANDKVDWWRITVPASGNLMVSIEPSFGLDVALYGPDGVAQIANPSGGEAGTFYVKVCVDQPGSAPSYMLHTLYTDVNFLQGYKSYDEGNYEECIDHLEAALRSPWAIRSGGRSDLLKARLYLGIAYIAKNWMDKASEQFKAVLKIDPSHKLDPGNFSPKIIDVFNATRADLLKTYLDLGISYIAENRKSEALEQFKAILKIDPDYKLDPDDFSPKITDVFDEARQMMSR
jgi:hypothetical protein